MNSTETKHSEDTQKIEQSPAFFEVSASPEMTQENFLNEIDSSVADLKNMNTKFDVLQESFDLDELLVDNIREYLGVNTKLYEIDSTAELLKNATAKMLLKDGVESNSSQQESDSMRAEIMSLRTRLESLKNNDPTALAGVFEQNIAALELELFRVENDSYGNPRKTPDIEPVLDEKNVTEALADVAGILNEVVEKYGTIADFNKLQESNPYEYSLYCDKYEKTYEKHKSLLGSIPSARFLSEISKPNKDIIEKRMLLEEAINAPNPSFVAITQTLSEAGLEAADNEFLTEKINSAIRTEKQNEIYQFPVDRALEVLTENPGLDNYNKNHDLYPRVEKLLENAIVAGDLARVESLLQKLGSTEKADWNFSARNCFPRFLRERNFSEKDSILILSGQMPQWIYDRYKDAFNENEIFKNLIPEKCIKLAGFSSKLQSVQLDSLTQDAIKEMLALDNLQFDTLDLGLKLKVFNSLKAAEIDAMFEPNDLIDFLNDGYLNFEKIPPSLLTDEVRIKILEKEFDGGRVGFDDLSKSLAFVGKNFSDLSSAQRAEIMKSQVMVHRVQMEKYMTVFSTEDLIDIVNQGFYIDPMDIPESLQSEVLKDSLNQLGKKMFNEGKYDFMNNPLVREAVFTDAKRELDLTPEDPEYLVKRNRLENIEQSFWVKDKMDSLPSYVQEKASHFTESYGKKGQTILSLAIAAYGLQDEKLFAEKLTEIENVINLYSMEHIPDGARVTCGMEYEVGLSIGKAYDEASAVGYVRDIEAVSRSARIGKGIGGSNCIHEIATKPTDNPYVLIAETKLLQDAGFLDFNFQKYTKASTGYHISLGGESGLSVSDDMLFLSNIMTLSSVSGINAGNEINNVKSVHSKNLEQFEGVLPIGARVEFKGMSCDSFEQFERAVITTHHAAIASQIAKKYYPDGPTEQEQAIMDAWSTLKNDTAQAVRDHNESFGSSEFSGGFLNEKGEYIDTGESIDIPRNRKLIGDVDVQSEEFKEEYRIPINILSDQQTPQFVNALTRINNIFLKKPIVVEDSKSKNNSTGVNARSVLDAMKREGYEVVDDNSTPQQTIFDRGGKTRDGYYYFQGASEEMISHKSQILLSRFNKQMELLLRNGQGIVESNEKEKTYAI